MQNHPKVTRPADALKHGIFKGPFIWQSRPLLLFARQKCVAIPPALKAEKSSSFLPHSLIADDISGVISISLNSPMLVLERSFLDSREIYCTSSTSPGTATCCRPYSPCSSSSSRRWCCCWCSWCGWWLFMWVFRLVCWVNRFPHSGQGNRYLSSFGKWITSCFFKVSFLLNPFPQKLHLWGVSPVCVITCFLNWSGRLYFIGHWVQWNLVIPRCLSSMWDLRWELLVNFAPHSSHWNGFSRVWTIWCTFRAEFEVNAIEQLSKSHL